MDIAEILVGIGSILGAIGTLIGSIAVLKSVKTKKDLNDYKAEFNARFNERLLDGETMDKIQRLGKFIREDDRFDCLTQL